jgi:hypothetical protein
VARVSPLKHANLNCLGRHGFAACPPREGLRPLRGPATVHLDEDDEDDEAPASDAASGRVSARVTDSGAAGRRRGPRASAA